jgi:uncharacterized membrane protein
MTAMAERHYHKALVAIWLITSLMLLVVARGAIADWKMGDPDDQLRLVQVRDWLAGQSWWDITQYRMNPPHGGPMHWSRLVDVPIAGMILLLKPFLGQPLAEQWACVLVPLLTYGCVLAVFAATAQRLFGKAPALLAAATFFTILPATMQILPMRIDHHGWQLFCFFAAAWALFDPKRSLGAAAIIGFAMALWIEISIEGLPFAIVFMGILGLRWLFPAFCGPDRKGPNEQLPMAMAALAGGTAFFYLITEGVSRTANLCDGLSPFHLGAFAAVAAIIGGAALLSRAMARPITLPFKIIIGSIAAAAGLAVVLMAAPQCTRDAFAELDPLVRKFWYDRVPEGLPLWAVQLDFAMQQIAGFLFGVVGLIWVLWRSAMPQRADKLALAILFLGSALVGTLVSRTMVYAVCLATIMLAPMALTLFNPPENSSSLAKRMAFRVIAILLLLPTIVGQNVMNRINAFQDAEAPEAAAEQKAFEKQALACQKPGAAKMLNRIPAAQLMVGLDTSPAVLQFTHHKVVATGHHRNQQAMADVIRTFTGTAEQARAAMERRGVDYFITCDGSFELRVYEQDAPQGFGAQIRRGQVPGWLVPVPDIGPFHVWRFDRSKV